MTTGFTYLHDQWRGNRSGVEGKREICAWLSSKKLLTNSDSNLEVTVNRKELEMRIWGKTIASAKKKGIISEEEAQFLLDEYLKEFKVKNGWDGVSHFIPRVF